MSTAGSVNEQLAPIEHVMLVLRIYGSLRTRLVSVFCLFGHVTSNRRVRACFCFCYARFLETLACCGRDSSKITSYRWCRFLRETVTVCRWLLASVGLGNARTSFRIHDGIQAQLSAVAVQMRGHYLLQQSGVPHPAATTLPEPLT